MSLEWFIQYWPEQKDIERWFKKLSKEQTKSVGKELAILRRCGNELKLPHSRALGKKLFELRERRYGYRIYYTFHENQVIILLTAGDKTTQKNDIKIARDRLEILLRG